MKEELTIPPEMRPPHVGTLQVREEKDPGGGSRGVHMTYEPEYVPDPGDHRLVLANDALTCIRRALARVQPPVVGEGGPVTAEMVAKVRQDTRLWADDRAIARAWNTILRTEPERERETWKPLVAATLTSRSGSILLTCNPRVAAELPEGVYDLIRLADAQAQVEGERKRYRVAKDAVTEAREQRDDARRDAERLRSAHVNVCVHTAHLGLGNPQLLSDLLHRCHTISSAAVRGEDHRESLESLPAPEPQEDAPARIAELREQLKRTREDLLTTTRGRLAAQEETTEAQRTIERLEKENRMLRRERAEEVWCWQGDEYDHPESLSCPVLIEAADLRALLARVPTKEAPSA